MGHGLADFGVVAEVADYAALVAGEEVVMIGGILLAGLGDLREVGLAGRLPAGSGAEVPRERDGGHEEDEQE
jgi:hypothetical protein